MLPAVMRTLGSAVAVATCLAAPCAMSAQDATIQYSGESIKVVLQPGGVGPGAGAQIEVSMKGRVFAPTERPEELTRFIDGLVGAYAGGTVEDALRLWGVDERDALRAAMHREIEWTKNASFYRAVVRSDVCAVVQYGRYEFVIVQHHRPGGTTVKVYPTAVGTERHLTNRLKADDVQLLLVRRVAAELIRQR